MSKKSTLITLKLLLLSIYFLNGNSTFATPTYCYPTFASGCFSWSNQSISIGTINWTLGSTSCSVYDYTSMSTNITPGVATPMSVTAQNYCGCAVWVDLNNNGSFDDAGENFHTEYVAGPSGIYTYNFSITLPGGTPAGSYRMRVLAGWGANGTTGNPYPTGNGVGSCGA